ncbi:MAG: UDP-N-acetylmuramoyl-L-alanyl-D-glutamate--2,6-diaminopimelate ligase [Nitrospinae bacterium]|nr:UDP-N-acetylmuramoyl-L-alanyl-D-glutamate--2,6-diaminopimelate ligase [Nitrospinota bacterium]
MTISSVWLLNGLSAGLPEVSVSGVEYDSRKVGKGSCFVAVKGFHLDGHAYVQDAIARGASLVVAEEGAALETPAGFPVARVKDTRKELARLAARFHGDPSAKIGVIGVTGTNGKTTTTYLIQNMLNTAGYRASRFGTIEYAFPDCAVPAPNTTPESADLQKMFARAAAYPNPRCVMEVSSHGLALGRLDRTSFKGGVFTNLTQDHLDFHQTMEEYARAKQSLFTGFDLEYAVINLDDPAGERWAAEGVNGTLVTYGGHPKAVIRLLRATTDFGGGHIALATPKGDVSFNIPLPGHHNIQNAMAAFSAGYAEGIELETVVKGIETAPPVPGRFEKVDAGQDFAVIVDYAHTDNALENVLKTARGITKNRLICVFGCGGDRDRTKRPKMGRIAADMADQVVVTSDNPRTEVPHRIIEDIMAGIPAGARGRVTAVTDREEAISHAIGIARAGDMVLIAGKGHEDYQIVGTVKHLFDDRKVAAKYIRSRG